MFTFQTPIPFFETKEKTLIIVNLTFGNIPCYQLIIDSINNKHIPEIRKIDGHLLKEGSLLWRNGKAFSSMEESIKETKNKLNYFIINPN